MTSRSKNAVRTYEAEIEKNREESNWKKVADLAQQLKARSPLHESLAHFLIGEGKLEAYLDEWPPIKENIERAQRELSDARGYLTLATDDIGKKAGVALDAFLLLGKLNYACGAYDDALKNYKLAELNNLTEKELPVRSLKIVAESYAIKGLCLEQTTVPSSTSRYKQAEKESEMIRSFEVSSELSLLYLQRVGGTGGGAGVGGGGAGGGASSAGVLLETALQRAPLMHMRAGRLNDAIDRYREMLTAVECPATQGLRLPLARQLAEVLLRGVPGQLYRPPQSVPAPPLQGTLSRRRDDYVSEGPWKPKKYAGLNQFVPRNEFEEATLLLLVGEAMAVRDAVLSQSAEFEAARAHALRSAAAVADLLALLAARWGRHRLLLESLERAMKFSFGCAHIWRQRALATAAAARAPSPPLALAGLSALPAAPAPPGGAAWGAAVRAVSVARRAAALKPRDVALRLVAAATCYRAAWIEEGLEFAQQALAIAEKEAERAEEAEKGEAGEEAEGEAGDEEGEAAAALLPRCHLYCGIGHQMMAQKSNSRPEKEAHSGAALRRLTRAAALDAADHLALYHLALLHRQRGDLADAMDATRSCLSAHAECAGALRLAAALWAAPAALAVSRLARAHYPAAEWPLADLARLLARDDGDAALAAGKELLRVLHAADAGAAAGAGAGAGAGDVAYADLDALSDSQHDDGHSNRDAASVRAESAGAFRVERALSATSSQSARARSPLAEPRAHAWLLLAELCLRLDRTSAAAGCVSEAAALMPYSHLVFYMRGRVQAAAREWEEARQCFQNALAIHPTHLDSIVQLGATYYSLGWLRLAERALREAGALQPARADTWRRLALVLAALGEPAAAADAAAAALQLPPPRAHEYLFDT